MALMSDFRSERMPSPEGEGRSKDAFDAAWSGYFKTNKAMNEAMFSAIPGSRELLSKLTRNHTSSKLLDLFGFWVWWRLAGGFEGTQKALGLSRSGMYRRIALFREAFGEHPDVFEMPGITVDPVAFTQGFSPKSGNDLKD